MFADPDEFAAYLDRLAERAPKLRDAGVLRFEAGGIKAELVAHPGDLRELQEKLEAERKRTGADVASVDSDYDPLQDPVSYGLPPGTPLPPGIINRSDA